MPADEHLAHGGIGWCRVAQVADMPGFLILITEVYVSKGIRGGMWGFLRICGVCKDLGALSYTYDLCRMYL